MSIPQTGKKDKTAMPLAKNYNSQKQAAKFYSTYMSFE
jgi:hypothetical protein